MEVNLILDVCCGPKSMWFDKNREGVVYGDKRKESHIYHSEKWGDRKWSIAPDVLYDFVALPFKDESFDLIVFDPPHLQRLGITSFLAKKYGTLFIGWEEQINAGFKECMRALKSHGTLIFKWSERDIAVAKIIEVLGSKPLFGNRGGKFHTTHWLTFVKHNQ